VEDQASRSRKADQAVFELRYSTVERCEVVEAWWELNAGGWGHR